MRQIREKLEWLVQGLIVYSLVMLFVELEVSAHGPSAGLFLRPAIVLILSGAVLHVR